MSDIRDWGAFIRGRWDWSRYGYEKNFPRGCQFTDVDAAVEFGGKHLLIETKHYEGTGKCKLPAKGQLIFLKREAEFGKTVLVLYGCGACNDPYVVYDVGRDKWHDWTGYPKVHRRELLKEKIDAAMGVARLEMKGAA